MILPVVYKALSHNKGFNKGFHKKQFPIEFRSRLHENCSQMLTPSTSNMSEIKTGGTSFRRGLIAHDKSDTLLKNPISCEFPRYCITILMVAISVKIC